VVTVDTAKKSGWMQTTAQPGSLQAFDSADVYARIPGFIKMLKVDIGSRVKKGEILAEIEAPEIVADVEKARAEVERARVRRTKAMAALQVAQAALELEHAKVQAADAAIAASEAQELYRSKQLGRIRQLVARGQVEQRLEDEELDRYVSAQSELKMARSQRAVVQSAEAEARAKVEMARADAEAATIDVRIAEVGVEHANDHLGYTRIVSPYDGVVTRRPYHVGELVGSPNVGKAAPLFTIVRSDLMRVVVPVPDRDTRFLDLGDPAKIWIDALPGAVFEGVVSRTAYEVDTHNRTLRVEIDLPNKDGRLRPGQHGRVEIQLGAREDALTIRSEAIWDEEHTGLGACFRIVGGRAVRTPVTFARVDGRRVEILDGLKEGDVVIIPQGRPISDGQPVIARPIEGR
jgi:RND family efflux transporter MFP subunit